MKKSFLSALIVLTVLLQGMCFVANASDGIEDHSQKYVVNDTFSEENSTVPDGWTFGGTAQIYGTSVLDGGLFSTHLEGGYSLTRSFSPKTSGKYTIEMEATTGDTAPGCTHFRIMNADGTKEAAQFFFYGPDNVITVSDPNNGVWARDEAAWNCIAPNTTYWFKYSIDMDNKTQDIGVYTQNGYLLLSQRCGVTSTDLDNIGTIVIDSDGWGETHTLKIDNVKVKDDLYREPYFKDITNYVINESFTLPNGAAVPGWTLGGTASTATASNNTLTAPNCNGDYSLTKPFAPKTSGKWTVEMDVATGSSPMVCTHFAIMDSTTSKEAAQFFFYGPENIITAADPKNGVWRRDVAAVNKIAGNTMYKFKFTIDMDNKTQDIGVYDRNGALILSEVDGIVNSDITNIGAIKIFSDAWGAPHTLQIDNVKVYEEDASIPSYNSDYIVNDDFSGENGTAPAYWSATNGSYSILNGELNVSNISGVNDPAYGCPTEAPIIKSFKPITSGQWVCEYAIRTGASLPRQTAMGFSDGSGNGYTSKYASEMLIYGYEGFFGYDINGSGIFSNRSYSLQANSKYKFYVMLDMDNKIQMVKFKNAETNETIYDTTCDFSNKAAAAVNSFMIFPQADTTRDLFLDNFKIYPYVPEPGWFSEDFNYADNTTAIDGWSVNANYENSAYIKDNALRFNIAEGYNYNATVSKKFNSVTGENVVCEYEFTVGDSMPNGAWSYPRIADSTTKNDDGTSATISQLMLYNNDFAYGGKDSESVNYEGEFMYPHHTYRAYMYMNFTTKKQSLYIKDLTAKTSKYIAEKDFCSNVTSADTIELYSTSETAGELNLDYIKLYDYDNDFSVSQFKTDSEVIENGDTNISAGQNVKVVFNQPVNENTINGITVSGEENYSIDLSEDGTEMNIVFPQGLDYNTNYSISLPSSIKCVKGTNLSAATVSFTTCSEPVNPISVGEASFEDYDGNTITSLSEKANVNIVVPVTNIAVAPIEAKNLTMIAVLKKDGKFYDCYSTNSISLSFGESAELKLGFSLPTDTNGLTCEVYVWDSVNGMRPYGEKQGI